MNPEKVIFGFFTVLALTLNFGFFVGDIGNHLYHTSMELFLAIIVNLIATFLKWGDRSQLGAVLLATSLVADLQLLGAAAYWGMLLYGSELGGVQGMTYTMLSERDMSIIVSLSAGALVANIVSVVLLVIETMTLRR
jgi:hypothetical protein